MIRHYTDAEFSEVYKRAASVEDVARSTGYKLSYVLWRAYALGLQHTDAPETDQHLMASIMEAYCKMSPEWRARVKIVLGELIEVSVRE